MNRDTINLTSEKLFPFQFQLLGIIFSLVGAVFLADSRYSGFLLLFAGLFILTGYRGIQFDRPKKRYRTYNSFLFVRFGKWKPFDQATKLFVNPSQMSQKIYTRITEGSTFRSVEYNSYLKLSDGTKEYLATHKNLPSLLKKLDPVAKFFDLEIINNATPSEKE